MTELLYVLMVLFSILPALAQDEPPPAPPFAATFTLHVCQRVDEYVFSYDTERDINAAASFLSGVDEPLHWGALFVLYADPQQRSTFSVPLAAVTDEALFGAAQWTVIAPDDEQQMVMVDDTLTVCEEPPPPAVIGQGVSFVDEYQRTRQGMIVRYLYQTQLDFPLFGMDTLMYVIEYGEASQRILNRADFVMMASGN